METKETREAIENEADNGLANTVGSVAMARTNDPHSATSQFFINVQDNGFLNHSGKSPQGWGYCVFAQVTEGLDVGNKIKAVDTCSKAVHQAVSVVIVVIQCGAVIG